MHPELGQQRAKKRRGRQAAGIAVVGVADIHHFVHRRDHALRRFQHRVEHASIFVQRFAFHAQRNEVDADLHRVDEVLDDGFGAQMRLGAADVLGQIRPGGNALDDRAHQQFGIGRQGVGAHENSGNRGTGRT